MTSSPEALALLSDLLAKARRRGADAADAILVESASISLAQRLGQPERLERSEGNDIGLRVFVGRRQAIVSSCDRTPEALEELAERAVAMARLVPEDPFCGLADPALLARDPLDLDIRDPQELSSDTLVDWAKRAEDAARAVPGVTNSEGAEASWGQSFVAFAASNGFAQSYGSSRSSFSVSVLAGEGTGMERDYDYTSAVYAADLETPEVVGGQAGEKAVRRLGPRKVKTCAVPVVFDPRVAGSILGHLAGALNGASIARGTSFLKDKMDQQVLPAGVTVVDDPHRPRGLRSKPFDGEGVVNRKRQVVRDGVVTTWILDLRSARQLGMETTGHAARGTSSPPSPSTTNLYLEPGPVTPHEMIEDIKSGLYVTELIGMGVNGVTGDYSRGATGFWIDNGQIAYPVSELTIAGNLKDMFLHLTPGNDLTFRYGTDSPTLRIDGMTVAGR